MLLHRLLTALVLIPLVVAGILYLSTPWIALIIGIIIVLGAWEWAGISGWQTGLAKTVYASVIGLILVGMYASAHTPLIQEHFKDYVMTFFSIVSIAWCLPIFWIVMTQVGNDVLPKSPWVKGIVGGFILIPTWAALSSFHAAGEKILLTFLVLIWVADSSAYFVGKLWGKRKLVDKVSPGKTWEGVVASLLITASLAGAFFSLEHIYPSPINDIQLALLIYFIITCLLVVIASIIGDLTESLFKRQAGLKDSGNFLPGHGGILDRIDGLTAAAPVSIVLFTTFGNVLLSAIG